MPHAAIRNFQKARRLAEPVKITRSAPQEACRGGVLDPPVRAIGAETHKRTFLSKTTAASRSIAQRIRKVK